MGKKIPQLLDEIQENLFNKAKKFLEKNIDSANNMNELKRKISEGKIVRAYFLDEGNTEGYIKEATQGATSRIIEEVSKKGKCIQTGKATNIIGYFAKSY